MSRTASGRASRRLPRINSTTRAIRAALLASTAVLAEFGNMSSPTVLFILDRLAHDHAPRPCVALAFGPGLTIEAALFV